MLLVTLNQSRINKLSISHTCASYSISLQPGEIFMWSCLNQLNIWKMWKLFCKAQADHTLWGDVSYVTEVSSGMLEGETLPGTAYLQWSRVSYSPGCTWTCVSPCCHCWYLVQTPHQRQFFEVQIWCPSEPGGIREKGRRGELLSLCGMTHTPSFPRV